MTYFLGNLRKCEETTLEEKERRWSREFGDPYLCLHPGWNWICCFLAHAWNLFSSFCFLLKVKIIFSSWSWSLKSVTALSSNSRFRWWKWPSCANTSPETASPSTSVACCPWTRTAGTSSCWWARTAEWTQWTSWWPSPWRTPPFTPPDLSPCARRSWWCTSAGFSARASTSSMRSSARNLHREPSTVPSELHTHAEGSHVDLCTFTTEMRLLFRKSRFAHNANLLLFM